MRARFFLLGALSLLIQTLLLREAFFVFHGGEIGFGLFFAVWLAGIGAGARLGVAARRARASGTAGACRSRFDAGLCLLALLGAAQVIAFRASGLLFCAESGGYLGVLPFAGLLLLAAVPAAWLTGWLFPLGLSTQRIGAGSAYGFEALGSMAGGACASLIALSRMAALPLLGLGLGAAALPALVASLKRRRARWEVLAGVLAAALLASGTLARLDRATLALRWRLLATGTDVVEQFDTPYHHVTLAEREQELSLYLDGAYRGALRDPYVDSLAATQIVTQHPAPRRLLLLAPALLGPGSLLAERAGALATHVRADTQLDRMLRDYLPPTGALERVARDPRAFVRSTAADPAGARYDQIAVLHGGAASGASNRLYTVEFFTLCARLLRPGGMLALRFAGAANVASPEESLARASIHAALRACFADVRVTPGPQHCFFAAQPRGAAGEMRRSPLTWNADSLAARRARAWPTRRPWPAALFGQLYPAERIETLAAELAAQASTVPPNRDRRPITYFEQLRRWARLADSPAGALLAHARAQPWLAAVVWLALLLLAAWPLRAAHGPALVSLASTGLTGMGMSLLLLFVFQSIRGTLYLHVGLVVAAYMLGLGAGALSNERRARRHSATQRALAVSDLAWVAFLLAAAPLTAALARAPVAVATGGLLGVMLLAGWLTAAPFPWAVAHLARARGYGRVRAGGWSDAVDHGGAVAGALVTGIFFIPLLGIDGTLLLLAAVKASAALGWSRRAGARAI